MRRLKNFRGVAEIRHPWDVERIMDVLARVRIYVDAQRAQQIWEDYSETYAAGWMMLPQDDQDILDAITVQDLEYNE